MRHNIIIKSSNQLPDFLMKERIFQQTVAFSPKNIPVPDFNSIRSSSCLSPRRNVPQSVSKCGAGHRSRVATAATWAVAAATGATRTSKGGRRSSLCPPPLLVPVAPVAAAATAAATLLRWRIDLYAFLIKVVGTERKGAQKLVYQHL